MNDKDYAFKSSNELFNRGLGIGDLLEIITFLQGDRKQWINQYTIAHNDYVELQQENHQLAEKVINQRHALCDTNKKIQVLNARIEKAIKLIEKYKKDTTMRDVYKYDDLSKTLKGEENK